MDAISLRIRLSVAKNTTCYLSTYQSRQSIIVIGILVYAYYYICTALYTHLRLVKTVKVR